MRYIVIGRSIDGTLYYSGCGCWSTNRKEAFRFGTRYGAQMVLTKRIVMNGLCEADLIIGHLRIEEEG